MFHFYDNILYLFCSIYSIIIQYYLVSVKLSIMMFGIKNEILFNNYKLIFISQLIQEIMMFQFDILMIKNNKNYNNFKLN